MGRNFCLQAVDVQQFIWCQIARSTTVVPPLLFDFQKRQRAKHKASHSWSNISRSTSFFYSRNNHTRISRCWLRRTNFLQSVLSPPLSLFSASQRTRGVHRLFAHMRPHMSVKMQEDPLNLHIFHLDVLVMKNKSNKDLRWPLLELLKSSKILFTV